jgi:pre-mRNA-splicing factor 38A
MYHHELIFGYRRYVRALGAFYMRLTGTSLDCYKYLEPLLNDFRKMRYQKRDGREFC